MTEKDTVILQMVRSILSGEPFDIQTVPENASEEWWRDVYKTAAAQGVLALCYDIVKSLPAQSRPPKPLHISWALSAEKIENRYFRQLDTARLLADAYHENGIRIFVLKGLAVSQYYPAPSKRECGDIDCFLGDDFDKGNSVAESMGAKVDYDFYKHSHIIYRGTLIENHKFCISIRGSRKAKSLEKHLESMLCKSEPDTIADTHLLIPPADFNAVFLARHALFHFLSEGINLRHIIDWHCFLSAMQDAINWPQVNRLLETNDLKVFTDAMTAICVKYLGLSITNPEVAAESEYADIILEDIFSDQIKLFSTGLGKWRQRMAMVRNIIGNRWRYERIYGHSMTGELIKYMLGFLFERNPQIARKVKS